MGQRFSAADRQPAAAAGIKMFIPGHLFQNFLHRTLLPKNLVTVHPAGFHTLTAQVTVPPVQMDPVLLQSDGPLRTGLCAAAAQAAKISVMGQYTYKRLSLRIGAPRTVQGTALQKHNGPNPGAIVHGIFLDVENMGMRFTWNGHESYPPAV